MKIYLNFISICLLSTICINCKNANSIHKSEKDNKSNLTVIQVDSTTRYVDSCFSKTYSSRLEEYINFDSNAYVLYINKNKRIDTLILDLPPGKGLIQKCSENYIVISSSCGGPCWGNDFIFLKEKRENEVYMFCNIALNNENIITHHVNEEFEEVKIRNLKNSKEITVDVKPCENNVSYPCGIHKMYVDNSFLSIIFDSPEDNRRQIKVDISSILN